MNQANKNENTIKTCHAYLTLNIQKNIVYSLVIAPTVSTIFMCERFEKAMVLKTWNYYKDIWKKSICTKGGSKHLSHIYINTGKRPVLL